MLICSASLRSQTEANQWQRPAEGLLPAYNPDPSTSVADLAPPPAPTPEDLPRAGLRAWADYKAKDAIIPTHQVSTLLEPCEV